MVNIHFILFVVYSQFISSGGYFEDFIGGKCVFKESEWSDWNETVKDCSEKIEREKTFFVLEPKGICNKTRSSTNESILAAGVCLGDEKGHEIYSSKSTQFPSVRTMYSTSNMSR